MEIIKSFPVTDEIEINVSESEELPSKTTYEIELCNPYMNECIILRPKDISTLIEKLDKLIDFLTENEIS